MKQISVFLENKKGRLNELLRILKENNIDIRSLSIAETMDYGIARLILDKRKEALEVLKDANMVVKETEVIAIEVGDEPGTLYNATTLLSNNNINLEYAYCAISKNTNKAIIILRVDKPQEAIEVIKDIKGIDTLNDI